MARLVDQHEASARAVGGVGIDHEWPRGGDARRAQVVEIQDAVGGAMDQDIRDARLDAVGLGHDGVALANTSPHPTIQAEYGELPGRTADFGGGGDPGHPAAENYW
jgi:hypothetical protein